MEMPSAKPRIQITVDDELDAALKELGGGKSRSRAVHDLALRGAETIRAERSRAQEAQAHLRRIATGEDDRYDFAVSAQLHAAR